MDRRIVLGLGAGLLGACAKLADGPSQPAPTSAGAAKAAKPLAPAAQSAVPGSAAATGAAIEPVAAPDPATSAGSSANEKPMPTPVFVDVWHDLVCPWCRIGCHNLHAAVDQLAAAPDPVHVVVRYHPFLLEPATPPEGYDLRERLASKYGAARLDQMFASVTQRGAQVGLRFAFDKVRVHPSTVPGHALVASASPAQQRPLLDALHTAYFEHGANLGQLDVLTEAAAVAQIDPGAVADVFGDRALHEHIRTIAQDASRSGIDGVPHFRTGAQVLHGAQPTAALIAALRGG